MHDAARPCLSEADINKLIDSLCNDNVGGILGIPVADTIKRVGANNYIEATVDRCGLWRALTPQMFRLVQLFEDIHMIMFATEAAVKISVPQLKQ